MRGWVERGLIEDLSHSEWGGIRILLGWCACCPPIVAEINGSAVSSFLHGYCIHVHRTNRDYADAHAALWRTSQVNSTKFPRLRSCNWFVRGMCGRRVIFLQTFSSDQASMWFYSSGLCAGYFCHFWTLAYWCTWWNFMSHRPCTWADEKQDSTFCPSDTGGNLIIKDGDKTQEDINCS